jgi:hypothetical protein
MSERKIRSIFQPHNARGPEMAAGKHFAGETCRDRRPESRAHVNEINSWNQVACLTVAAGAERLNDK